MAKKFYYPLNERVRFMIFGRYILAPLLLLVLSLLPNIVTSQNLMIFAKITSLFLAINVLVHLIFRFVYRLKRSVLNFSIFCDVVYISTAVYLTGGTTTPLIFLYYLYLISVTLLLSYKTGLKASFLVSLFYLCIYYQQSVGFVQYIGVSAPQVKIVGSSILWQIKTMINVAILLLITAWTTLFSAINEGELKKLNHELEILNKLGIALEKSLVLSDIISVIINDVKDKLGFDRVAVFLIDKKQGILVGEGGFGFGDEGQESLKKMRIQVNKDESNILIKTIESRVPQLARNYDKHSIGRSLANIMGRRKTFVCVPLLGLEQVEGVLVAGKSFFKFYQKRQIKERDIRTLTQLGKAAALAIDNAKLHLEMRNLAITDALTDLYNHRYFQQKLEEEIARIIRYQNLSPEKNPLSLAMLDVDYFKQYNDQNGHQAGDRLLRELAGILKNSVRGLDTVARYGGEEFVIILPQTDYEACLDLAERIRRAVEKHQFEFEDSQPKGRVTISIGVATFDRGIVSREALIKEADQALYVSKKQGRNRTTHQLSAVQR